MNAVRFLLGITVVLCAVSTVRISAQSDDEYEIFQLVNRERSRARLAVLDWDDDVARLARNYSKQMAREGFFDHYDSRGRTVMDRADESRVRDWSKIGENLFMCTGGPEGYTTDSVRGWMRSPSHRRNILDREWTTTGIGIYRTRDDRIYVTQVFIRR